MYLSDENTTDQPPLVIGKVEFLSGDWQPGARDISRAAILKFETAKAKRAEQTARSVESRAAALFAPSPTVTTVAPCELCIKHPRFAGSTYCADCIRRKAVRARENFLNRELTPRDLLMMCLLAGLLLFCIVRFGSPQFKGNFNQETINRAR